MKISTCVFDAYGTLFDVAAAAREAAAEPGNAKLRESWEAVASNWRLKQLQYTWLRAVTGAHADFWKVTCDGLDWALEAAGLGEDEPLKARLLGPVLETCIVPRSAADALRLESAWPQDRDPVEWNAGK